MLSLFVPCVCVRFSIVAYVVLVVDPPQSSHLRVLKLADRAVLWVGSLCRIRRCDRMRFHHHPPSGFLIGAYAERPLPPPRCSPLKGLQSW